MELKLICKLSAACAICGESSQYLTDIKNTDGIEPHDKTKHQEMEFLL